MRLEICTSQHEAWRYPCYSVSDLQLMEAVPPPAGVGIASPTTLSHNSDEGHGNTLMAGRKLGI